MKKHRQILVIVLLLVAAIGFLGLEATSLPKVRRVIFAARLFSEGRHIDDFQRMNEIFPVHVIPHSSDSKPFLQGEVISLPSHFSSNGDQKDSAAFLRGTDTTGLLIVRNDHIVYEGYWLGTRATTRTIGWSLTKSFVSALVGIAMHDGKIASIQDPVTRYAPELKGSAYDGVTLKDVLQMSSGASWNENYNDWNSDINRFGRTIALGGSLDAFIATLKPEFKPGTYNRYNSMDTQALGLVLRRATGETNSDYLETKLWQPLGMQDDAYWVTDDVGSEFVAGGLNATLRDYAKLGELYLQNGNWGGKQLVPEDWVKASVTPDAPHLTGKRDSSNSVMGYGMQWWIPDARGDFSGIGVFHQFIYVNPTFGLVIAKTSATHNYGAGKPGEHELEDEHIAFFQAIEEHLGR